jgi:adenylate cyclase
VATADSTAIKRKLATILAADVAGYSRLMSEDEEATLRTLGDCRRVIDRLVTDHDGRIFNTAGDSVVAEFASPVEAVRCGSRIQVELAAHNVDVPPARRMRFRIGVHLGDVMVDGDNLLGDGVNVAARLEALAEAGGLAISGAVHDHVDGKLDLVFDFEGEKTVKNITRPVPVYRLKTEDADEGVEKQTAAAGGTGMRPSIAVLPFENLGGDKEQDYFADGISEDLITELARFQELNVVARNSSFTYKGRATKVQDVGRELGVRYVLEGSVRKAGNRVRITAQLIDAPTGHHLWAERFDRDVEDLFAVQDEVTQSIVATLAPTLEDTERKRMRNVERTDNLQAYDLALRARELWFRFEQEDNREARRLYERAIELDPDFVRAHAGLAWTYLIDEQEGWSDAAGEALQRAQDAARKAVQINPASHSAWLIQGWVQRARGELARAAESIERALKLNPNDADSYVFLANVRVSLGQADDAIELCERSFAITSRSQPWHSASYGAALYAAHRYEDAIDALTSHEGLPMVQRILAMAYAQLGHEADARRAADAFLVRYPDFSIESYLAQQTFKRDEDRAHYAEGMKKAGLPE